MRCAPACSLFVVGASLHEAAYTFAETFLPPRVNAEDEDDGYLVSFVTNENAGTSECILIDAKRFADGPVWRIALPHKICSGTHAHWARRPFRTAC